MGEMSENAYQILVVDDEPSICEALAMGLTSQKFMVDVARNGEVGVQLACTGKYDILIADLALPDMIGIEVIRRIKGKHPEIIPLVITAYPTEEGRREARQSGVTQFVEKPFTLNAIKAAVMQALAVRDDAGK